MYYVVDGARLKIDFVHPLDPYPFSGEEMKMYWDVFGAVTFKTIFADDFLRLRKGMAPAEITEALGSTIDVGSGRHILMYTVWDGLSLTEFAFNTGGGGLPYTGKEIHAMFQVDKYCCHTYHLLYIMKSALPGNNALPGNAGFPIPGYPSPAAWSCFSLPAEIVPTKFSPLARTSPGRLAYRFQLACSRRPRRPAAACLPERGPGLLLCVS